MYENNEEQSDIIGKSCTLLNPYKGYTEGTVVGDYGDRIIVSLTSGKEISEYRDEVIIYRLFYFCSVFLSLIYERNICI